MYAILLTIALWLTLTIADESYSVYHGYGNGQHNGPGRHRGPGGFIPYNEPYSPYLNKFPGAYNTKTTTITIIETVTRSHFTTTSSPTTLTAITSSTTTSSATTTPGGGTIVCCTTGNIITNSDFELLGGSLAPWIAEISGNDTDVISFAGLTQPGDNSANAARIYATSDAPRRYASALILQTIPVITGATYTISYDIAVTIAQPDGDGVYNCFFRSAVGGIATQNLALSATQGYQTFTNIFVADGASNMIYLQTSCNGVGTGEVEIDNVSVVAVT